MNPNDLLKTIYAPSSTAPTVVEVPRLKFLMITGRGNPNTCPEFRAAIEAIYSISYALKFLIKKQGGHDFKVMPLEGLWWAEDSENFGLLNKEKWIWTLMIAQPDIVDTLILESVRKEVLKKKKLPSLKKVVLEEFEEGRSAQIMFIGPYSDEGPTIAKLHEHIASLGHRPGGKHHEIYLNDPRRTAPEKLKTIIRLPF